ncbi:hypothetical protein [Endozoicomonas numazuensis]|uniref:Uncharacterized protein n=1 Tax=Endozoicomonas numazuensis TaxID=1137799 RepID=A0A081NIC5_9GAMM|nr:hypothetical protein [Endozoicomonas numazuensis]KEQ18198.1 hypothetical protein GZ78_11695 [Endozoicomonas numazuensis]
MTLEARVAALEENREHWDKVLTGIEGTVALILKEQMEQKKEVGLLKKEMGFMQKENNSRFDKIEELLIQIVNNLALK